MKSTRRKWHVAVSLFFLVSALPSSTYGQQVQGLDPDAIPIEVRVESGMSGKVRKEHQQGSVSARALTRSVAIKWEASALTNSPPDYSLSWDFTTGVLGNAVLAAETQEFSVSYYPTAIGKISDTEILVCGMKAGGVTIVQKWAFIWTAPMPPVVADPVTGLSHVAVLVPNVQRSTLYSASNDPIVGVCGIKAIAGESAALVQFSNPPRVMRFSLDSGGFVLLASESGGSIGPIAMLSTDDYAGIGVLDHNALGYTYRCWRKRTTSSNSDVLLFVDSNRDGILDSTMALTSAQFQSQELFDLNNYNSFWAQ